MINSDMIGLVDKDLNVYKVYIYFTSVSYTGDNIVVLDRSLSIHYGDLSRVNQRVDILRKAGKQVFLLKNILLKGALM